MRNDVKALGLVLLSFVSGAAAAAPVQYQLTFQVEYIEQAFDPALTIGTQYHGAFALDDTLLAIDGMNQGLPLDFLTIQMSSVLWCYNLSCAGDSFQGFRGPQDPFLGAPSPGFDVVGGDVVNLRGGVFGVMDSPFVDFSYSYPGAPPIPDGCTGAYCGDRANSFWTRNPLGDFGGSMRVTRVPEPGSIALLCLGFAALGACIAKKRARAR